MTQKQILKNNLLLARFENTEPEQLEKDIKKAGCVESMGYHKDWLWLMPVIEKIESLSTDGLEEYCHSNKWYKLKKTSKSNFSVDIFQNECYIYIRIENINKNFYIIGLNDHSGKTKIEAVYKACVQFVKWWNKCKK